MRIARVAAALLLAVSIQASGIEVRRLAAPDFKSKPVSKTSAGSPVKLRLVSEQANRITDDDAWFERHSIALNRTTELPDGLPEEVDGLKFLSAIQSGDAQLGLYGENYSGATVVVGPGYAFDFSEYRLAPRNLREDLGYVEQRVQWAEQRGHILYVSHGHSTYAKSSHGMNAYLSAIDTRSGKALWHSAPLVANSENFLFLDDDHILTGYGFTAEPDFLYVLRAKDGVAVAKVPLKSGPSYLIESGGKIFVRTYNRDYVFRR